MTCEQRLISVTRGTKELGGRTNKQKIRLFDCFFLEEPLHPKDIYIYIYIYIYICICIYIHIYIFIYIYRERERKREMLGSEHLKVTAEIWNPEAPESEIPKNKKVSINRHLAFIYLDIKMYWYQEESLAFKVH